MTISLILLGLFVSAFGGDESSIDEVSKRKIAALRSYYAATAARYEFFRDSERQVPLQFVKTPVMTWTMDNDWGGDVFVWTHAQRPEIIGCILSAPEKNNSRKVYEEFHLLSEQPIGPVDLLGGANWAPKEGLKVQVAMGAPIPADTAPLRLSQKRQIMRDFTAKMQAEGEWELRQLTQPLLRYQPTEGVVVDGALFAFVWPKGTDPELILLLECRKTEDGLAWYFSPAQFTTREIWLKYRDKEVWRVPGLHNGNKSGTFITRELGDFRTTPGLQEEPESKIPSEKK